MFRRVHLESWQEILPYIGFTLIAVAFLIILFRAIFMKPADAERLASLPLDDSGRPENTESTNPAAHQR